MAASPEGGLTLRREGAEPIQLSGGGGGGSTSASGSMSHSSGISGMSGMSLGTVSTARTSADDDDDERVLGPGGDAPHMEPDPSEKMAKQADSSEGVAKEADGEAAKSYAEILQVLEEFKTSEASSGRLLP